MLTGAAATGYCLTLLQLRRKLRQLHRDTICGQAVLVGPDITPAVAGVFKPQIVLPQWLAYTSGALRTMVLAHEVEHVRSRDSSLLHASLFLVALVPWNLPLWWQLRRLRLAIEIDCDARVVGRGFDPIAYAESLLSMARRDSRNIRGGVGLIRATSLLAQRIHVLTQAPPRFRVPLLVVIALGAITVGGTVQLHAPAFEPIIPIRKKPPPDAGWIQEHDLQLRAGKLYTEMIEPGRTGKFLVRAVARNDGSIEQVVVDPLPIRPDTILGSTLWDFRSMGLRKKDAAYVGEAFVTVRGITVPILFAVRTRDRTAAEKGSEALPAYTTFDTSKIDYLIVRRLFPRMLDKPPISVGRPWVLFDRVGNIVKTGYEPFETPLIRGTLGRELAGVAVSEETAPFVESPTGRLRYDNRDYVRLHCVWLAP
jgi:hypothetical protein